MGLLGDAKAAGVVGGVDDDDSGNKDAEGEANKNAQGKAGKDAEGEADKDAGKKTDKDREGQVDTVAEGEADTDAEGVDVGTRSESQNDGAGASQPTVKDSGGATKVEEGVN